MKDIFDSFNEAPVVRTRKKYATFTVKEIGGPEEIIAWRKANEAKLRAFEERSLERDSRVARNKFDSPTLQSWSGSSFKDRQAFAKAERKRLAEPEELRSPRVFHVEQPKKPIIQRIIGWIARFWQSANF